MSATAAQITRVRRMTNEKTSTTYADADVQTLIEAHPLVDADGFSPEQDNWTPTYDLNAAAADIWEEKASAPAQDFNFSADGGNFSRSQVFEQYMQMARYYRARRSFKGVQMEATPKADEAEDEDE